MCSIVELNRPARSAFPNVFSTAPRTSSKSQTSKFTTLFYPVLSEVALKSEASLNWKASFFLRSGYMILHSALLCYSHKSFMVDVIAAAFSGTKARAAITCLRQKNIHAHTTRKLNFLKTSLFQWRPSEWYSKNPHENRRSSGPVCGLDPA